MDEFRYSYFLDAVCSDINSYCFDEMTVNYFFQDESRMYNKIQYSVEHFHFYGRNSK